LKPIKNNFTGRKESIMNTKCNYIILSSFVTMLIFYNATNAGTRIAILDFELNDITSLPNTQAERVRTASIKPLLEQAISRKGDYDIVQVSLDEQKDANAGVGYLFRFHDIAAQLGKKFGADWIIVGQHSKPSFLYSYLMAQVIHIGTESLAAEFDIELKGNHTKVTERGVMRLVKEITDTISGRAKKNMNNKVETILSDSLQ
jgi:Protein of unknown function (DUF2380)